MNALVSSIYESNAKPATGRKERGQERPLEPRVLKDRAKELIRLSTVAKAAAASYSAAVKATAEASGFNTKSIRGMVEARRAGDDVVKRAHRDAVQLQIAIDETSELAEGGQTTLPQ